MIAEEPYWETSHKFLNTLLRVLQLDREDILIEAGSGNGLAACQIAFESRIFKVIGIENVKDRHESALACQKKITQIAACNQRPISSLEFLNNDFRSEDIGELIESSTVMFCAINSGAGTREFLEHLLQNKEPGFRICTNLSVYDLEFLVQDPRIQGLKVFSKTLTEPNTTLHKNFLPFYVYSIRLKPIAEFGASAIQSNSLHVEGEQIFLSLQIGRGWTVIEGKIIEAKQTHSLVETGLGDNSNMIIRTWLPNNEIFKDRNMAEQETFSRNWIESDQEQLRVMPSFISPEVAEVLKLVPQNVIYVSRSGFQSGPHRFDLVHEEKEARNYFKLKNPQFVFPCKFSSLASRGLKFKLPSESLTLMSSIYGDKEHTKHPVLVTHKSLRVTYSEVTIKEMENHLNKSPEDRSTSWALQNILVLEKNRHAMKPPKALRYYDKDGNRQIGVPDDENSPYQMLDLSCSMVAKGSLRHFTCDTDGAIVWVTVKRGTLLFFILSSPSTQDMVMSWTNEFIGVGKKGKVLCVNIGPGETLVYPSFLPHAWYASKDVLSYGGRYLLPSTLYFNLQISRNFHTCYVSGYTHQDLVSMTYRGLGNMWYILWKLKILDSSRFYEEGNGIFATVSDLFEHYAMLLNITREESEWTSTFFHALVIQGGSNLVQSLYGVFYPMDSHEEMKQVFKRIIKGKTFFPALTNVTNGLPFRNLTLPNKNDLDYDDKSECQKLSLSDVVPLLLTHTSLAYVGICQRKFGMFATCNLEKGQRVALYTGHIRSESGLKKRYGHGKPPGKVYFLNEYISKKGKVKNAYIDANTFGSFSLFAKQSYHPNCTLEKFNVQNRVILIVVTDAQVVADEELFVPRPTFYSWERDNLFSIDNYIEDPCVLEVQRSKPRILKTLQKSKPQKTEPQVTTGDQDQENQVVDDGQVASTKYSKKNKRDIHVLLSSYEDSNELEGGTPSGPYSIEGVVHQAHHIPHYPTPLTMPVYRDLSPSEQRKLRNTAVALFYPEFKHYKIMNKRLFKLYKQNLEEMSLACAVCGHFGYPIDGFPDEIFHRFERVQLLEYHHSRYHKGRLQCETCNELFDKAKLRDGHYRSMIAQQDQPHVADAAKRVAKRKEEEKLKKKKKEEREKKKDEKGKKSRIRRS